MKWFFLVLLGLTTACGDIDPRVDDIQTLEGAAENGESNYSVHCARCHGPMGRGTPDGSRIAGERMSDQDIDIILGGDGEMPGYSAEFTDQEVADLRAYVESL